MNTPKPIKVAVLISGNGSNLQAIIDHQASNKELYEIVLVISNRPNAFGLKRAEKAGIKYKVIDHTKFLTRAEFDQTLQINLDNNKIELVVLAGFMRILTTEFTEHYLGKMLNIHPSLLPKYTGLNTHQRALDAGDKEHGLSVHFVTPELDGGPVILQAKVIIDSNDNAESLANKVHEQEYKAYPEVISWFAQRRLKLKDNQAWLDQKCLNTPFILNS